MQFQWVAGADKPPDAIQPKALQGFARDMNVPRMRRIERATQQANDLSRPGWWQSFAHRRSLLRDALPISQVPQRALAALLDGADSLPMVWTVHYLNARGALDAVLPRIDRALRSVEDRVRTVVAPPKLDIVVQSTPGRGLPMLGFVGHTPRPGTVFLSIDPEHPRLPDTLGEPLERNIAHEVHHALRFDGAGYGKTLGEALVSEGLAGLFVFELFDNDPEPWEIALNEAQLAHHAAEALPEWAAPRYDHARWFFGTGDLPQWTGYSLGYAMARLWAMGTAGASAAEAAAFPASDFIAVLRVLARGEADKMARAAAVRASA